MHLRSSDAEARQTAAPESERLASEDGGGDSLTPTLSLSHTHTFSLSHTLSLSHTHTHADVEALAEAPESERLASEDGRGEESVRITKAHTSKEVWVLNPKP